MQYSIFGEWINPIGWTLLHSLWQAALLAFVYYIITRSANWSSRIKHNIGMLFLLTLATVSLLTFAWSIPTAEGTTVHPSSAALTTDITAQTPAVTSTSFWQQLELTLAPHLGWLSLCWGVGLLLMSLRLLGGWWFWKRRIIGQAKPLPETWQHKIQDISTRIGLATQPIVKSSERILVPAVVGVFKPVIVLPLAMLNQLEKEQAEAVLLHEMTHILRKDHWMNLLQSIIETVYYFNPFVWFISAAIRKEREHSCDDKVVEHLSGGVLIYAKALLAVEMMDSNKALPAQLAIGLFGKKQALLERIQRLVHGRAAQLKPVERAGVFTSVLMLFGLMFLPWQKHEAAVNSNLPPESIRVEVSSEDNMMVVTIGQDTLPAGNYKLKTTHNGKRVELKAKDGDVTSLRINGKQIPPEEYDQHEGLIKNIIENIPPPPPPPAPPAFPTPPTPPSPPTAPTPPVPPTPPASDKGIKVYREIDEDGAVMIELISGEEEVLSAEALEQLEDARYHPIYLEKEIARMKQEIAENYPDGNVPEAEWERLANRIKTLENGNNKEVEVVIAYLDEEPTIITEDFPDKDALRYQIITTDTEQLPAKVLVTEAREEWWVTFLMEQGLITDPENFKMRVNRKSLKVNGVRASQNVLEEFLARYEAVNGHPLTGKSEMSVSRSNDKF